MDTLPLSVTENLAARNGSLVAEWGHDPPAFRSIGRVAQVEGAELVYYVATTIDGFIAHEDGSFDGFSWDEEVVAAFLADLERFGTVLMGRKTYDVGLEQGTTSPYPAMRQIVFSRTLRESPDEAVELFRGEIGPFVRRLKKEAEAPIWLCGGGEIASTLMAAGLVDRLVVKLNPIVFGTGIPLFRGGLDWTSLTLVSTRSFDCGVVVLDYEVGTSQAPTS